jgi:hypothetical protein
MPKGSEVLKSWIGRDSRRRRRVPRGATGFCFRGYGTSELRTSLVRCVDPRDRVQRYGARRRRSACSGVQSSGGLQQPTPQPALEKYHRLRWPCYAFQLRPVGRRFEPEEMSPVRAFAFAELPCTTILNETHHRGRNAYTPRLGWASRVDPRDRVQTARRAA